MAMRKKKSIRDTNFENFAEMLFNDLSEKGLTAIANTQAQEMVDMQEEINDTIKQIIAQRAFDLVAHAIDNLGVMAYGSYMTPQEKAATICDMAEWPKEQ